MGKTIALDVTDNRTVIQLSESERNLVLGEMRDFLKGVREITQGVANKDIQQIADSAKKLGMATAKGVPPELAAKLPVAFKKLAFDTHSKFDEISRNAEDLEDESLSLSQVATLMNNCIACHATYRLEAVTK